MLMNIPLDCLTDSAEESAAPDHHTILMVDTTYAHTLNQVLFHSQLEMSHAHVSTCLCTSLENRDKSVAGAQKKLKDLHILGPLSLKDGDNYMVLEYTSTTPTGRSGATTLISTPKWKLSTVEFFSLS